MTDQNIFDTPPVDPQTPPVVPPVPTPDPIATKLMEIKNEDGTPKYATLDKAIEALANSQTYIPTLQQKLDAKEAELAELKAKQESSESTEAIVARLLAERETPAVPNDQQAPKGLDEAGVAKLVQAQLEAKQKQDALTANANKVTNALTEKFGERTKDEVAKKAVELGTTPEKIGQLAMESPEMVLSLFQTSATPVVEPSSSDVNTSNFLKAPPKDLEKPRKSLLSGASSKEQAEYMKQVRDSVYQRLGVETK